MLLSCVKTPGKMNFSPKQIISKKKKDITILNSNKLNINFFNYNEYKLCYFTNFLIIVISSIFFKKLLTSKNKPRKSERQACEQGNSW